MKVVKNKHKNITKTKKDCKNKKKNKDKELTENIKRKHGRIRYRKMSNEDKQKLKEYQKNCCSTQKKIIIF